MMPTLGLILLMLAGYMLLVRVLRQRRAAYLDSLSPVDNMREVFIAASLVGFVSSAYLLLAQPRTALTPSLQFLRPGLTSGRTAV